MSSEAGADFLKDLNEVQRKSAVHTKGPCLIIAGAGSGKTRVLTYRIAYLIREMAVPPASIVALTFTNKAAKEMRERIEKVAGSSAQGLWMGTFHSVFAKVLRKEARHLGYESSFSIYDTDDSKHVIGLLNKEMNLDESAYKAPKVLNRISMAKTGLMTWDKYQQDLTMKQRDAKERMPMLGELYKRYVLYCKRSNAMDFDDLLFNTFLLFKENPDVLQRYQEKFSYVLVDEFQDTNRLQYQIAKSLAAPQDNICVVGDDSQSIYAFRGATIRNILDMRKDYPNLYTLPLEQNYRSSDNIVKISQSIIDKNQARIPKKTWTGNPKGEQIEKIETVNDHAEGLFIADQVFEQKRQFGYKESEMAILYRTNSQSRVLEESLRKRNIKYRIYGGLSFYQRKEVKDLLAYLRLVVNPSDEQAMRRIINTPRRGIGDGTVHKIVAYATEKNKKLWEGIQEARNFLSARISVEVEHFAMLIDNIRMYAKDHDADAVARQMAQHSGLLPELREDKTVEGRSRYDNMQELLNAVGAFVDDEDEEDKSLHAFLQKVSLLTSADTEQEGEAISLMTVHMAKGLEFKVVFIAGLEENLFPMLFVETQEELEEERRLFYVAVTRAEKKLFLCYALTRYRFGSLRNCEPSRFLSEVAQEYLHSPQDTTRRKHRHYDDFSLKKAVPKASIKKQLKHTQHPYAEKPKSQGYTDSEASDINTLQEGMQVEHLLFGIGTILKIDRQNTNWKAKVSFDQHGEKNLLLSFARLRVIS